MCSIPDDEPDPGFALLRRFRDHWAQTQLRAAIAVTQSLVTLSSDRLGPDHPTTWFELGKLGVFAGRAGKTAEAGDLLQRSYAGLRRTAGGRDIRLARVATQLASLKAQLGDVSEAEDLYARAYRIRREVAPETVGVVAPLLGELLAKKGEFPRAAGLLQEGWQYHRDRVGESHPETLRHGHSLTQIYLRLQRHHEAIPLLRTALSTQSKDPERAAQTGFQLGMALHAVGQRQPAIRALERSLLLTRGMGDPHPKLPERLSAWAGMMMREGKPGEGEGLVLEALEAERRLFGDNSLQVARRYQMLGRLYVQMDRKHEAMGYLEPAASMLCSALGTGDQEARKAVAQLAELLFSLARETARKNRRLAREYLVQAVALSKPVLGPTDALVLSMEQYRL